MAESTHIQFGDCEIDLAGFTLRRGGMVREVEPQVLELLIYLARNADRLITKDDLIKNVWHGRVVSDTAITSRIKSARQAIGDDGTQQKLIRTVHGRGVRFVGLVRTGPHDAAGRGGAGSAPSPLDRAAPGSADARTWPAIAVLPFANIGGDRDQDCLVDGLTEDIITELSRFGHLRVVARGSCFRYRDSGDNLQKICRELAADYVVTGSVRRRGSHLRLSARLMAADNTQQLWADRFDRDAEDVFLVADELVGTIVATLAGRVRSVGSALAKRKPPANLAAYECVLRAQAALVSAGDTEEDEAGRLFEQALISDPDYPRAHAGLAIVLVRDWYRGAEDTQAALDRALNHAQRAVAIDSHDNECEETLAWVLLQRRQFDLAEQHYRRAIELNPYSPDELAAMGSACSYLGRPGEGIGWFELAKRTDPFFDPAWYWNLLGVTYFNARRYDEAAAALEHLSNPPMWIRAYAAASHAMAGRIDAAKQIAAFLAEHAPGFSALTLLMREPFKNPADREHLADGLRKAGLLSDKPEVASSNTGAEASRYYLVGRSSFIHGPGTKPSFEAAR